jgi:hypothetical protein
MGNDTGCRPIAFNSRRAWKNSRNIENGHGSGESVRQMANPAPIHINFLNKILSSRQSSQKLKKFAFLIKIFQENKKF